MAIFTIDPTKINFTAFDISTITDKKIIKTGSINSAIYSSGQVKKLITAEAVTATKQEQGYLRGMIMGADYYNDSFKLTLPSEIIADNHLLYHNIISLATGTIEAGVSSVVTQITVQSYGIQAGEVFNFEGKDRLYTVVSINISDKSFKFFPRLEKQAVPNSDDDRVRVYFHNPTVVCNLINTKYANKTAAGTEHYSKVQLTFQEI